VHQLAALSVSACGESSVPAAVNAINNAGAAKGNKTFKYTGSEQRFTVPKGERWHDNAPCHGDRRCQRQN
jgi:hypothetical protein